MSLYVGGRFSGSTRNLGGVVQRLSDAGGIFWIGCKRTKRREFYVRQMVAKQPNNIAKAEEEVVHCEVWQVVEVFVQRVRASPAVVNGGLK